MILLVALEAQSTGQGSAIVTDLALGKPGLDRDGRRRIAAIIIYSLSLQSLMFLGAGTFAWPAAWLWFAVWATIFAGAAVYLLRVNPAVINERGRKHGKIRSWDRNFAFVYAPTVILLPLLAGLDYRFGWSDMWIGWQLLGLLLAIPGSILPYWAMGANKFLITTVQVQGERGHYVIDTGPYRYVRHPMYIGSILMPIGQSLLLGSWSALVIGLITGAAVIYRTYMEDRTLQGELLGYSQYAQRVRYRLFPGIW